MYILDDDKKKCSSLEDDLRPLVASVCTTISTPRSSSRRHSSSRQERPTESKPCTVVRILVGLVSIRVNMIIEFQGFYKIIAIPIRIPIIHYVYAYIGE